jgi:hypothetical protein
MKIFFTILIYATIYLTAFSQNPPIPVKQKTEKEFAASTITYRLFQTQNMWTFIKLNTRNGQMSQIQYDINGSNRFETYLNIVPLVNTENEANDRFTLCPTQNIYTFILLDQFDGKTWQVQWSSKIENRFVIPIEHELPMIKELVDKLIKGDTTQNRN